MNLKVRKVDDKGYFIESKDDQLVFVNFGPELKAVPEEWRLKILDDLKNILIIRLSLDPK